MIDDKVCGNDPTKSSGIGYAMCGGQNKGGTAKDMKSPAGKGGKPSK